MIHSVINHIITQAGYDSYPMIANETTPPPFVVYANIITTPKHYKGGMCYSTAFTLIAIAQKAVDATTMGNVLKDAFHHLTITHDTTVVDGCVFVSRGTDGEMAEGGERYYFESIDFKISHKTP